MNDGATIIIESSDELYEWCREVPMNTMWPLEHQLLLCSLDCIPYCGNATQCQFDRVDFEIALAIVSEFAFEFAFASERHQPRRCQ